MMLSTEAKVVYTAFLVFSLAALVVSVLYYSALTNHAPVDGAGAYYAPRATIESAPIAEESDGPLLELPDDIEAEFASQPLIVSMTPRKLLEVTHFHLFTIPVFLLIITHIFMLCQMSAGTKMGWILSGTLSTTLHMAAPWLVYLLGPSSAWLMAISGAWMTLSMIVLTVWPIWFMWRPGLATE